MLSIKESEYKGNLDKVKKLSSLKDWFRNQSQT